MKETYFTASSIDTSSREMQDDIAYLQRTPLPSLQHAVLLVLDMQRVFLDNKSHAFIPSAPAVLPGLISLIQEFRSRNHPVIFTRHTNAPGNGGQMSRWWRDLIDPDSVDAEIIPELATPADHVIEKHQYDAFYKTDLHKILGQYVTNQVVITGVMTHLCCETTARSAFVRGFEVFFPLDTTATYRRDFHLASLLTLSHGFAHCPRAGKLIFEDAR